MHHSRPQSPFDKARGDSAATRMASGRARLPPTPGTVSMVPCTRPLTELHANNNLYHSSTAAASANMSGDGSVPSLDYQHQMHHPHSSQPTHLMAGGGGGMVAAPHHHHLLHHQQEVGLAAGVASSQLLPDAALGHGVTQSLRKPFDAPRQIPERPSQLADESDWMSDYADSNLKRRSSISKDYLTATAGATTTADWLKKSIRRSWTISNAEDDNGGTRDPDAQPYPNPHLPRKQSQSSYPSLVKHPYFSPLSMADEDEYGEEEEGEVQEVHQRQAALRRAMPPRQSTLPNPEGIYYGSNNNLMPTVSPKQQLSPSPQYNTSPYQTDNEADNETGSDHRSPLAGRYKIRRQSTLPCKPNEMLLDGGGGSGTGGGVPHGGSGPKIMMSSSPNSRTNLYSKSPERDGIDASACKQQQQRFPPFVRQSTFPSNTNDPFLLQIQSHSSPCSSSLSTQPLQQQQQQQHQPAVPVAPVVGQQRQLPTSPNRLVFNKSPDSGTESGPGASESSGTSPHQISATAGSSRVGARSTYQMTRQATLPNPEQHMKLLPTSPPKKQLSPHSIKRSPDFARQNTLPASPQQQQQQAQQPAAGPQSAPVLMPMPLAASSCSSLAVGPDGTATTASTVTMNSLSVHQHGPKFMPISPRQKASFLFPQPAAPTPRPFHSQQHFPTHLNTSPSASTVSGGSGAVAGAGTVTSGIGASHSSSSSLSSAAVVASKMIKVRSHSNEEYTLAPATRPVGITGMGTVSEGRRMLPEIPTSSGAGPGGSRSPRLVRQEHVRDELLAGCVNSVAGQGPNSDKRTTTSSSSSPKQKTFAEAKQTMAAATMMAEDTLMGFEPYGGNTGYDGYYDEDQELSLGAVEGGGGIGCYQDNDDGRTSEPFKLLPVQQQQQQRLPYVPTDSSPDSTGGGTVGVSYGFTNRKDRLRSRRKSRDAYDHPDELGGAGVIEPSDSGSSGVGCTAVATGGEPVKRKPETMRSISEEAPAAKPPKPITRRSLSHPEKDSQLYGSKKLESSKIPSPKPLTELHDRQYKPSVGIGTATSPRRKNIKSFDCGTISSKAVSSNLQPGYHPQQQYHQQATESSGGPSSVSPGVATESTRTSGYGGSATTLGGNASGAGGASTATGTAIGGFQSFGQRKVSAFQQILQRQRLQKRDSKSLDVVASKLMEEKYGCRAQDVDVSKSLDDGIFSESAGHQSDDNSSDEHINLAYKSSNNKTTLREAEIQNAVEAAAVIFKKVVLQRREENKCKSSYANHECHSCADGLTDDSTTFGGYSSSETEAAGRMHSLGGQQHRNGAIMPTDYEEYRLVFFSSDSSSKEEEYDSSSTSSSTAMRHAKRHRYTTATSLEECDWDYFEPDMMPGADEAKSAFFYEMLTMATATAATASGQCANAAASATTSTSKASRKLDSSYCHCDCCNRRQMQYVPIPVPVPVPVPIAAFQSWLYEQQQQLLLMHGTPECTDAADHALRSDLVQQLWKKFAECGSDTSVRSGAAPETAEGSEARKGPSNTHHPKFACRFGGSRRDVERFPATSESHDSSDNERNAATVRTCKHISVRRDKSSATAVTVNSQRGFVIDRSGGGGSGGGGSSSGFKAPAAAVAAPNGDCKVQVQKTTTPPPAWPKTAASLYGVMRRDGGVVVDGVDGISDIRRRSLASSGVGDGSAAVKTTAAALQLLQHAVVVPPLCSGEFSLAAVPVTTNAANDIVTTTAEPIQAQDNIVTVGKAANGRDQIREITTDSNVRAGVAAASSSSSSLPVVASVTDDDDDDDDDDGAGLKPEQRTVTMDDQTMLVGSADQTEPAELAHNDDIELRVQQKQSDGNVNVDSEGTSDNTSVGKNQNLNSPRTDERRESSKNRPHSAAGEQDGHLQYELLYHLAQTGGRSSPSSSSASSSETESTAGERADRKVKVGKYSFQRAESSGDGSNSARSSVSSASSYASGQCGSSSDSDSSEGDTFDRDRDLDRACAEPLQNEDDGCCFDGDDDDDDVARLPRTARGNGGTKRFSALMVVNPQHGSDSEGKSDSSDSSDNQSLKARGASRRYFSEVADSFAGGDYDEDSDEAEGAGDGVVVLKSVKNIPDTEGVREYASEQTKWDDDDSVVVEKCAEVSIEERSESIVGSTAQQRPAPPDASEWAERGGVDHRSNVEHATLQGGSRKSGETDNSSPQCCADVDETISHQVEEKGTVSHRAPEALSYASNADCQQKQHPLKQQQLRDDSIKAEEKPQHHHDQHQHDASINETPHTGNSISSATGVFRMHTPPPPLQAQGVNVATCVSSSAMDECVGSATTTTNTTITPTATARGDIRSPQTPRTVDVETNTSTVVGFSRYGSCNSNKYTSLVMITADTSETNSTNVDDEESKVVNYANVFGEGNVVSETQVNVAADSSPTSTTTETVPSAGVHDQSEHGEITPNHHQQHYPVTSTFRNDHRAEEEEPSLPSVPTVPECLPEQRQTDGGAYDGLSLHHHVHGELTHVAQPRGELVVSSVTAHDDRKSSTEGYEKNPTGAVMDRHNHQSPPTVLPDAAVRTVTDEENRDHGENVLQVSGDRDDLCVSHEYEVGDNYRRLCDFVSEADSESLVQPVSFVSVAYGNELEQYDNDGGEVQTQSGGNTTATSDGNPAVGGSGQGATSTLSAVICLEDGLADDDSWVEEISQDEEEFATTTATDSDLDDSSEEMSFANDREEELRGYNRTAIDFTLHTIVEESCEESEVESHGSGADVRRRGRGRGGRSCGDHGGEGGLDDEDDDCSRDPTHRLSASELEKYFFYGLGGDDRSAAAHAGGGSSVGVLGGSGTRYVGGAGAGLHDDHSEMSEESSSLCSDGHDSLGSGTASGSVSAVRLSGASIESHEQDQETNFTDSVADLASSRLEKYFLTGFLGYNSSDRGASGGNAAASGGNGSDGSGGSVGSDSEGHASPEQRRKRLVRARGATRSHSSLDNLLLAGKDAEHSHDSIGSSVTPSSASPYDVAAGGTGSCSGALSGGVDMDNSSETDTCDESPIPHQDRTESSPYDTMGKRKKKFMTKKMDVALTRGNEQTNSAAPIGDIGTLAVGSTELEDGRKLPQQSLSLDMLVGGREPVGAVPNTSPLNSSLHPAGIEHSRKQTSRDSGFIGSNDDLLKEDHIAVGAAVACSSKTNAPSSTVKPIQEENREENTKESHASTPEMHRSVPPGYVNSRPPVSAGSSGMQSNSSGASGATGCGMVNLVRKDSFNNWSSDEETNLMMSKMRQFFKSLVAASANTRKLPNSSSSTPGVSGSNTPQQGGSTPVARPRGGMRSKPPQLVYFESELTRLMKTVPGIRDEQVREIVEYLSSEDTWSDSYDSSDYTSSDLEGTAAAVEAVANSSPFGLQEEISASCRQIINKFDSSIRKDEEGDIGDGGLVVVGVSSKQESSLVANQRHHHHQQQQQQQSYHHNTPLSKETAFVYQRLVASLSKVVSNETPSHRRVENLALDGKSNAAGVAETSSVTSSSSSPPLIAKVMHHIGSRLVALMHEVSSGESHTSVSPKQHRMGSHRKSGQLMTGNTLGPGLGLVPGGGGAGAAGGAGTGGVGGGGLSASAVSTVAHHHHHHLHHHHQHQIISATTTEDDEDSSTSESNDRPHHHHHHHHHHRSRLGPGATGISGTAVGSTGGHEEDEDVGMADGGVAVSVSPASYAMLLPRSKSHDLLLSDQRSQGPYQYHSGAGCDMVGEERSGEASDYERFSWRGSFESALLANGDSRTKLSMLDNSSSSKSVLVAKRRSAGDLLFNNQNLSQEQLDRVRSCGSIGGDREEFESSQLWEAKQSQPYHYQQSQHYGQPQPPHQHQLQQQHHQHYTQSSVSGSRRRLSSVAADEEDTDSDEGVMKGGGSNRLVLASRSTLPRSLQNTMASGTTNSLPRLPTSNLQTIMQSVASSSSASSSSSGTIGASSAKSSSTATDRPGASGGMGQKSQSVYHFLQNNVKSARYRAPGFNRPPSAPKRAMSAPGLHPPYPRRERRSRLQQLLNEESHSPDLAGSPGALGGDDDPHGNSPRGAGDLQERPGDGTAPNGMQHVKGGSMVSSPVGSAGGGSDNWPSHSDEDIDRLVALHQNRASLSSLGVRSDSMASVYSGAGEGRYGTVTVRGQIEFGMQYNYKQAALEIHVKQCKDLAAVDTKRNRSDPYVKVYLLPDKSKSGKRKTKVKKHTLNPVFDEVLRFHMSLNSLQTRTIWITVWHSDMFGRNDFLGEVMMGLQDKVFDNPQPQWYQLQERSEPFEDLSAYKGDIIVGLKYVSADCDSGGIIGAGGIIGGGGGGGGSCGSAGSGFGTLNLRKFSTRSLTSNSSSTLSGHSKGALHVLVKEAKHLQPIKSNGTCDAFCKSYLLPDKNRSSKQKTPVIKRTNSPVWNYTFVYEDVSLAELSERALELTIWDHDRLASNEFLGGVRFSLGNGKHNGRAVEWMDSTGKELSLWQNMINRPNFWVEGALVLRPSLENARFST